MHSTLENGQPPIHRHHDPRALIWELMEHNRPDEFGRRKGRAAPEPQQAMAKRPGLGARFFARLRGKSGQAKKEDADKESSASDFRSLGMRATSPYIRRTKMTGDDTESGPARRDLAA